KAGNVPVTAGEALLLLLLGVALVLSEFFWRNRTARFFDQCLSSVAILLSGEACLRRIAGTESFWEVWFVPAHPIVRGLPAGRMPLIAAVLFLLSSLPLLVRSTRFLARRWIRISSHLAVGLSALAAMVFILGHASGAPLFYGQGMFPVPLLTAIGILGLDIGLLADWASEFLTTRTHMAGSLHPFGEPLIEWRRQVALSAAAALIVLVGGVVFLRVQLAAMRRTAFHELAAIGDLKAEQISAWKAQRVQEARFLMQAPAVARMMGALLAHPNDAEAKREMAGLLQAFQEVN